MKFVGVEESKEFRAFLRGPSRIGISSSKLNWKGVVVEEHSAESGERSAAIADRHILGLVCGRPWTGEHPDGRGGFISNPNLPGMITFIKDGSTVPAISTRDVCEHVLCSLESSFLNSVLDELEKRPAEELHSRLGFYDPPARQIIRLLIAEAGMGGPLGRLYADHLGHALATRLLLMGAPERRPRRSPSPLPRHLLQRTLEQMSDLHAELDLKTLAAESGYSRGQFLRMFNAAMGCTPHQHILQVRVMRAQELMRQKAFPLSDVAAACGFSSHAHMSRVFHQVLGVTPSTYRRSI